ncbi:NIPSNAP family protein [Aureimonas sp. AU40]|uniref:NIPSNAP family protein n=1 Tax=Aureimonas sp. AU40 TaxID=1637747 RepID=UPI000780FC01|nr:NIPSNAP family protein [Aureimonas sp. AU40]
MTRLIETLLYTLKPGTGGEFDRIMHETSVPLHRRHGMDVVAYGPSLHDPDAYVLIRAYRSLDHLRDSQDAFYLSEDWREGPRSAIVERIEASLKAVSELPAASVDALRGMRRPA